MMTEHERNARQQERRAERDAIILGIYDALEASEPDISTERLLEQTAVSAHCHIDRVLDALRRERT